MKEKNKMNRFMVAFFRMYKMLGSFSVLALNIVIFYSLISYWDMSIQVRLIVFLIVIGVWALIELTNTICDYFISKFKFNKEENKHE